jgi:hypothetical protein
MNHSVCRLAAAYLAAGLPLAVEVVLDPDFNQWTNARRRDRARRIEARLRIFAGLCAWKLPEPEEMEIRAELRNGVIAFGTLIQPEAKEGQSATPLLSV